MSIQNKQHRGTSTSAFFLSQPWASANAAPMRSPCGICCCGAFCTEDVSYRVAQRYYHVIHRPKKTTPNTHHTALLERWHLLLAFCARIPAFGSMHTGWKHGDVCHAINGNDLQQSFPSAINDVSNLNSGVRHCYAACSMGAANAHTPVGKLVFCTLFYLLSQLCAPLWLVHSEASGLP